MFKGFGGFLTQDECEEKRMVIENNIADMEIQKGNTVYIETFCLEMEAFESQLEKKKELDKPDLGI